jgi:hypothetical protein
MRGALAIVLVLLLLPACGETGVAPTRDAGARTDAQAAADAAMPLDASGGADAGPRADAGVDASIPDASVSCDDTMSALPYPDEAPGSDRTVPPACSGCPSFDGVSATPIGTTASVTGTVDGAPMSCRWYLSSPTCGGASGAFAPNEFTTFSITLPLFCGTNRLQLVCESAAGVAVSTREIAGPSCGSRDLQVTLGWGATANDMELHLLREGAHINDPIGDCTWFTCQSTSPDWGVLGDADDDPRKDVDDTGPYGPENVFLTRAADGRYEVMVEYWGSGTADTSEITITLDGTTVWRGTRAMNVHDVWHVGTLLFPAATFTPIDTITPCSAAWRTGGSMGCALPIP